MKHITRKICVLAEVQMHLEEFTVDEFCWIEILFQRKMGEISTLAGQFCFGKCF